MEIRRLDIKDLHVEDPGYVDAVGLLGALDLLEGRPLIIFGPKGVGKTMAVYAWAAQHNYLIIEFGCTEGTREKHLYGALGMEGDHIYFTLGCLTSAIDVANEILESTDKNKPAGVVLLLNEINGLTPQLQKGLNSFADWQRQVSIPSLGRVFKTHKEAKLWTVGTMNPAAHGGTYALNEDLQSRFRQLWVGYPKLDLDKGISPERVIALTVLPGIDEAWVDVMLSVAQETRSGDMAYQLSTRDVVQALEDAQVMGMDKALKLLSYRYDEGTERDTFHTRAKAKSTIDIAEVELMVPPPNLRAPSKPGARRSVL
jgi:MoxR-like ATPase